MKKKIFVLILLILVIIFIILISKNVTKNSKNGNNMNSQEIVDKILNCNSYKAEVEVQVNSNKNKNKYIIIQEYNTENGCTQEVKEPSNLSGVKITKKDNTVKIENTELNLQKIFENYEELENNNLDLYLFLTEYKNSNNSSYEEKDGKIIMTVKTDQSRYIMNKILYIDKENVIPEKLLIQDNNQNTTIIIKYNNIELN